MAYMDQQTKARIAPVVKEICKRHGVKATLAVHNHSTLVLTISEGRIAFFADRVPVEALPMPEHLREYAEKEFARAATEGRLDVNVYWYKEHFTGAALAFLSEIIPAMNTGNFDNSDPMTDYFSVGWYVDVNVGSYKKPYRLVGAPAPAAPPPPAAPAPETSYAERVREFARYVEERETEESLAQAKARTITLPTIAFWQREATA